MEYFIIIHCRRSHHHCLFTFSLTLRNISVLLCFASSCLGLQFTDEFPLTDSFSRIFILCIRTRIVMVFIIVDDFRRKKKTLHFHQLTENSKIVFHNFANRFARFLKHVNVIYVKYFLHLVVFFSINFTNSAYSVVSNVEQIYFHLLLSLFLLQNV